MAFNLPGIGGQLLLDISPYQNALTDAARATLDFEAFVQQRIQRFGEHLQRLGRIQLGVGASLTAASAPGVANLIRVEDSLKRVQSVGDNTNAQMRELERTLFDIGKAERGPKEVSDAMFNLLSAGNSVDQVYRDLPDVLRLATASAADIGTASQVTVVALAAFADEGLRAVDVANAIAKSNEISSSNIFRLNEGYRNVAATARLTNVSFLQTTAALNILNNLTQDGARSGTQLNQALSKLTKGGEALSRELGPDLERLGLTLDDLNPSIAGLETVIDNLVSLELDPGQIFRAFEEEAARGISTLILFADEYKQQLEQLKDGEALQRQYNLQVSSTRNRLTRLTNTVTLTTASFAQGFQPVLNFTIDLMRRFVEALDAIPAPIKRFIGSAVAITGAAATINGAMLLLTGTLLRTGQVSGFLASVVTPFLTKAWTQQALEVKNTNKFYRILLTLLNRLAGPFVVLTRAVFDFGNFLFTGRARAEAINLVLATLSARINKLSGVLRFLLRVPIFRWLALFVALMVQAKNQVDILVPAFEFFRGSGEAFLPTVNALSRAWEIFGKILSTLVIGAVKLTAFNIAVLSAQIRIALALIDGFGTALQNLLTFNFRGAATAAAETVATIGDITEEFRATLAEIGQEVDDSLIELWFENVGTRAETLGKKLGITSDEAAELLTTMGSLQLQFASLTAEIKEEIGQTPLEASIAQVSARYDDLVTKLNEEGGQLRLVTPSGDALTEGATSAFDALFDLIETRRQEAIELIGNRFAAELRTEADQAVVAALAEGTRRINAQFDFRREELRRRQQELFDSSASLSVEAFAEANRALNDLINANEQERSQALAEAASRSADVVAEAERQVAEARVEALEDGAAKIAAQFALEREALQRDYDNRLDTVEKGSAEERRLLELRETALAQLRQRELQALELQRREERRLIRDRILNYRQLVEGIQRSLADLQGALGDQSGLVGILSAQQDAVQRLREQYQGFLGQIDQDLQENTITAEEAARRRLVVFTNLAEAEGLLQEQQLAEREQFFREEAAQAISRAQQIEDIYSQIGLLSLTDPLARADAERQRELSNLDAWYAEQTTLAEDNRQRLLEIEEEFVARQALINAEANENRERIIAEREAQEVANAQRLADIYAQTALVGVDDPLQRAEQSRDAEIESLESWYEEQIILARGNSEELLRIEQEYAARRELIVATSTQDIADAEQALREERTSAALETIRALQSATSGRDPLFTVGDLSSGVEFLQQLRVEMEATGATAEELVRIEAAIAALNQTIVRTGREAISTAQGQIRTLEDELTILEQRFADPQRVEEAQLQLRLDQYDRELDALLTMLDNQVENTRQAELLKTQLVELFGKRRSLLVQQFSKDQATEELKNIKSFREEIRSIDDEIRVLASEALGVDTSRRVQLEVQLEALDRELEARKQAIDQQVKDFEEGERLKTELTRVYGLRRALLQEQFNRRTAEAEVRRVQQVEDLQRDLANDTARAIASTLEGQLELAEAQFRLQVKLRRQAFDDQLKAVKATREERLRLEAEFNAREIVLERLHQDELAEIRRQLIGDAFASFERQQSRIIAEATEARQKELQLQEALLTPVERRISLLEQERVQLERIHDKQDQRQKDLEAEIALLKSRNDELDTTITNGSKVLTFLSTAQDLFGTDDEEAARERLALLERERDILIQQSRTAARINAPFEQRLALLTRLADVNEQIIELGGEPIDPVEFGVELGEPIFARADKDAQEYLGSLVGLTEEFTSNTRSLEELEDELKAVEDALGGTRREIDTTEEALGRLQRQTGEPIFIDPGPFGEQFGNSLTRAITDLDGEIDPGTADLLSRSLVELLRDGDVEGAVLKFMEVTGQQMPQALLEGILLSPAPGQQRFSDSLAETLGVDDFRATVERLLGLALPSPEELALAESVQLYEQTLRQAFIDLDLDLPPGVAATAAQNLTNAFAGGDLIGGLQQFALDTGRAIPEEILRGILDAPSPTVPGETLAESLGIVNVDAFLESLGDDFGGTLVQSVADAAAATEDEELLPREQIIADAAETGYDAGAALALTFADGIADNWSLVLSRFQELIGELADFLPSSDAKRGPLSNLTARGQAMLNTFMRGAERMSRSAARRMDAIMGDVAPTPPDFDARLAPLRRLERLAAPVQGVSNVRQVPPSATTYGDMHVHIDTSKTQAAAGVTLTARELLRQAEHEIKMRRATGGR